MFPVLVFLGFHDDGDPMLQTTASSLSWILLTLSQHPEIQQKARQEVMSQLPPKGKTVTYDDLEKLTYVGCVVKECLRCVTCICYSIDIVFSLSWKHEY